MFGQVPVWLLDVDGVINANRPGWGAAPRRGYAYADGVQWRIRWAPALIGRIRGIHIAGLAEVTWCTTWCSWAEQLERLFGLPPLPRAAVSAGVHAPGEKLAAACEVLTGGRRLIWTDDTEAHEGSLPAGVPDRALLIAPDDRRGLQPEHLDQIDAFLTATHPVLGAT